MINFNFFISIPVEFKKLCLIYPPNIKTVISNSNFMLYKHFLTLSQEDIEDEYNEKGLDLTNILTPFEYLLTSSYYNPAFKKILNQAFVFFTHQQVTFLYEQKQIIIGDLKEIDSINKLRIIKQQDFFDFQNIIRQAVGEKVIEPPNPNEDPRVKAIKAKGRYRDRVKAKKGGGLKLQTALLSICYMGIGINPLNIGELSYSAVPVLLDMYQQKEKYELDTETILAGADSKKINPKYWIRNLDN